VIYAGGLINGALVPRFQGDMVDLSAYGNSDITLAAIHPNGTQLWVRVAGTDQSDRALAVAFNPNGVLYIGARWNGSSGVLAYSADATVNNATFPAVNLTTLGRNQSFGVV
jgi:hypothetical protein